MTYSRSRPIRQDSSQELQRPSPQPSPPQAFQHNPTLRLGSHLSPPPRPRRWPASGRVHGPGHCLDPGGSPLGRRAGRAPRTELTCAARGLPGDVRRHRGAASTRRPLHKRREEPPPSGGDCGDLDGEDPSVSLCAVIRLRCRPSSPEHRRYEQTARLPPLTNSTEPRARAGRRTHDRRPLRRKMGPATCD